MKASKEESVKIKLELTGEEGEWLMSSMQNPFYGVDSENEDEYDKQMRRLLFECLYSLIRKGL